MYYVYILRSLKDGSYYKGMTTDLQRRLEEHNRGENRRSYSSKHRPWEIVWYTVKNTQREAEELELKLKNLSSRKRLEGFIGKYINKV